MSRRIKALLGMTIVSLFWAPSFAITKEILRFTGPVSLACLRFLGAALLMTAGRLIGLFGTSVCLKIHSRCLHAPRRGMFAPDSVRAARRVHFFWDKSSANCDPHGGERAVQTPSGIRKEDRMEFLLISFMIPIHYVLSNIASLSLHETESIMFSSFQSLLTLIIASLLINSKIKPFTSIYIGVAGIGAVLLMEFQSPGDLVKTGYVIMLSAMIVWVVYCVLLTRLLERYPLGDIIYRQFWIAGLALLPWLLMERNQPGLWGWADIAGILYLVIGCTMICFLLNANGIREIGPVPSSLVLIIGPVLVAVLNMRRTGFSLPVRQWAGITFVLAGIILAVLDVMGTAKRTDRPIQSRKDELI